MKNQVNSIKADSGRACLIDPNGNILLEPQTDLDILYYPSYGVSLAKKDEKLLWEDKLTKEGMETL